MDKHGESPGARGKSGFKAPEALGKVKPKYNPEEHEFVEKVTTD